VLCDKKITAKEIIMTDKPIEARIREHYVSENGEWLVEKGKVKEARLLKEACETIEQLRRQYENSERNYYRLMQTKNQEMNTIQDREKDVILREARLQERLASVKSSIEYMMRHKDA
jgi:hypothetical protein